MSAEKRGLRPRVALVATDLSTGGGVNRVIRDLATMFSEKLGCNVTVLNGRSARSPTFRFPPGVALVDQPDPGRWPYVKALWSLRRSRPDVVIGPWAQDNMLLTLMFLFTSTRVVLVEHASWHFHGATVRLLRHLIYPLADALVVLNPSDLAYYRRFVGNVRLVPNPVAPLGPARGTGRKRQIVAVGHLSAFKNFGDAIAAFARSGLAGDGWSLRIVGSGPEEARLREQADSLDVDGITIVPPAGNLAPLFRQSSIFLLTSRSESFSLVLAEAMAAGVAPLAYATDGPSYILEDFPELLVDIGDVTTLARRLRELAGATDLGPLRQRLARSIDERFAPGLIEARWRDLFNRLGCPTQAALPAASRQMRS